MMARKRKKKTNKFFLYLLVIVLLIAAGAGSVILNHEKKNYNIAERVVLVKKATALESEKIGYTPHIGQVLIADGISHNSYHVYGYFRGKKISGYMKKSSLQVYKYDPAFENNIALFPESYKQSLRYLHALYPNWIFTAQTVKKKTFNQAAKIYAKKALTTYTNPEMIASDKVVEGNSWRKASLALTKYVLDPRNALQADRAVVFEQLVYNSEESLDTINQILKGTALAGKDSISGKSYAEIFQKYCIKYNVSLSNIATRAKQENGANGLGLRGGTVGKKKKKYYNIFNIGANTGAQSGIRYAKKKKWTTRVKAIKGGIKYIAHHYIKKNQNTLYYQRFDLMSKKMGTNIYMTNITAPIEEAKHMMQSYTSIGSANITRSLVIPVFKDMPSYTAYPIASMSNDLGILKTHSFKDIANVKLSYKKRQKYNGSAITPKVTVKDGKKVLRPNVDYAISYSDNKNTGTASINLQGLNGYYGTVSENFTIE